ncbi:MAG: helix-turn-helix transcriptional regulator [Candidatus Eisenbacteria bacterium]|nr:helix-turn-helix transcriptional regulator [Candidatus Eisenbacteria bacterium]
MIHSTIVDNEELGRRVRQLRADRRLTLKQVENVCGLSATHLSEIERGRTSPTIGALVRIARALGRDASYFIEGDERPEVSHVTRERATVVSPGPGVKAETLSDGIPGSRLHAYRLTLENELTLEAKPTGGDALYFVRRGALLARIGDAEITLEEGDSAQATLSLRHRLSPRGDGVTEVIAVLGRTLEDAS